MAPLVERRARIAHADTIEVSRSRTVTEPMTFVPPVAPPATEVLPAPTARSRAVTRRFDRAELQIVCALADAAQARGVLADRDHEVAL
jgi:hypothetical protein